MRSWKERVMHMVLFEFGGLVIVTPLASALSGHGLAEIGILAVGLATAAMAWNLVWNWGFDRIVPTRQRSLSQRLAQAFGFELGLLVMTLPAVAWWMEIGLIEAFWLDAGFMLFFLIYAMVFNTVFDRVMQRRLAKGATR
ncbi:PACE efflux transporter [Halomonas sp. V046]|uniref:PACE efflux transporter n=1 Tax=Halomonas sp. V046 TaxID=3459611 RepID=UPI004044B8F9